MNLMLRCASQVMYSLRRFRCEDPDDLYRAITDIPWETLIASGGYFTVNSNVVHPSIRSGMFANVKVKDAIVDRMRKATGERPDSGPELRGTVVYLFWRNEDAEIFIDTSGETLAKHGYRKIPGKAPMVEALAAGTIPCQQVGSSLDVRQSNVRLRHHRYRSRIAGHSALSWFASQSLCIHARAWLRSKCLPN